MKKVIYRLKITWQDRISHIFLLVMIYADIYGNVSHIQKKTLKQPFHFKVNAYYQYILISIPMFLKINLAFL
jgi:hypothetical protein